LTDHHLYVLLTDTGTWFTTLIKSFTAAPYNHASLALDPHLDRMYSFGRKHPDKPWSAGFVEEDVYGGTFRRFPDTRCALLRLRVSAGQRERAIRVLRLFQRDRQCYRYNLAGLLGVALNFDLKRKNAYFCSQFVADTLLRSGLALWDRPPSLVTPDDFLRHGAFEPVYEGRLYDYPLLDVQRLTGARRAAPASLRRTRQSV